MINPSKFPRRLLSRIIPPALLLMASANLFAQPVADEDFSALTKRLQGEKPAFAKRQQTLLQERYDLADRPAKGVAMSRGKPVQDGVRVKLSGVMTWESLAALSPEEIKNQQLWPAGFLPLPHPHHEAGGMISPNASSRKPGSRPIGI